MKYFFLLVAFGLALQVQSQSFWIRGTVIDSAQGQPMAKASVFCQSTSLGTVTNAEGSFALELPNGGYDLIISFTGYEKKVLRISPESAAEPLRIVLSPQDRSLQEVAVVGSTAIPDGWTKYGSFFNEQFIGSTPNAAKCSIENPESLKFYFSKKKNRLKVMATEPIRVHNAALGYRIHYELDSFTYEYDLKLSTLSGNPRFESLSGSDTDSAQWSTNRMIAYRGSRIHFMKSWYQQRLNEEGFGLEWIEDESKFITREINNPYDSTLLSPDSMATEIVYVGLLRVKYRGETPHADYVKAYKLPAQIRVQMSVLRITDPFIIEENGYFYEQTAVTNAGYWSWEKVADLMPYDWNPSPL